MLLPCLTVSCFSLFGCSLLEACLLFSEERGKGIGLGREGSWDGADLGGVEGWKTVVRMYCVRADSILIKIILNVLRKNSNQHTKVEKLYISI